MKKKFCVLQKKVLSFGPNRTVEVRPNSSAEPNVRLITNTNVGYSAGAYPKGQMKSECIYEIIDFPKYHQKNLIDFCPESLFRLGMLSTHLSRVALRIIKTSHMYLVYKTCKGRNLSIFFGGILENR